MERGPIAVYPLALGGWGWYLNLLQNLVVEGCLVGALEKVFNSD
jgi:hypothetical protein